MKRITEANPRSARDVTRPRGMRAPLLCALCGLLMISACDLDLQSPAIVSYDEVDANLLTNGAIENWMTGWNAGLVSEWYASDEAVATDAAREVNQRLDETGDLTLSSTYFQGYGIAQMMAAREATRIAIQRAEDTRDAAENPSRTERATTALRRAKNYRAWFVTGLARRRGSQPIEPEGEEMSQAEQYEYALQQFADVIESSPAPDDSLRIEALAGTARLQWMLGSNPVDAERLEAAISAAEEVLAQAPDFIWAFNWPYSYIPQYYVQYWGDAEVAPAFADIPMPSTVQGMPAGDMFTNAAGLRLIIAGSHLLLGEVDLAKAALEDLPLLKTNHVGLGGRDPAGAPLSQSEVDAFVATLDSQGVQRAIDELRREDFYLRGRRNVSQDGEPLWPIPLPPNALHAN